MRVSALAPLALLAALSACRAVYAPTLANPPLLSQRGELHATVDPQNLQVAYAPAAHIGVIADAYYRSERNEQDSGEVQEGHGGVLELGAGWFGPAPRLPQWLGLEVYGGVGAGNVEHDTTPAGATTARHFEADGVKAFVMPSLGFTSKYLDAGVAVRLVAVRYTATSSRDYSAQQLADEGFAGLEDRTWWFVEPAATVRAGYKWLKLGLQVGKSLSLNGDDINHDSGMITLVLSVDVLRTFDR